MLVALDDICERLIMDAVDALLDGPRAERAFLLKAMFEGSWAISVEDRAALTVCVMVQGIASYAGATGPHRLEPGDVVLVRGPAPYVFADAPDTPIQVRILPGQVCVDAGQVLLDDAMDLGVRTWGNSRAADATTILIGTYERETALGRLLLERLPDDLVLRGFDSPLVDLLGGEVVRSHPGQAAVLDRLLDLVLVSVLREAQHLLEGGVAPDPAVAQVVGVLRERPEHPWTVQAMADLAGMSRAAFARRFRRAMGEPPLTHLTRWRLALAADLLAGTDLTVAAIAPRVGYANAYALSAAFKRHHGAAPRAYAVGDGRGGHEQEGSAAWGRADVAKA